MSTIRNSRSNTLIGGTSYADSIRNYVGSNVTINAGDGNDSIENRSYFDTDFHEYFGGDGAVIDAGEGDDSIRNCGGDYASLNAGGGNDTILNERNKDGQYYYRSADGGDYATIDAGDGDDSIRNEGDHAMIEAGDDDDTVFNEGDYALIDAGAGNDSIYNIGLHATLEGGKGDDTFDGWPGANVCRYASGDGDDVILNFGDNGIVQLTDGSSFSTLRSGDDLIISIESGSITLKNASFARIYGGSDLNDSDADADTDTDDDTDADADDDWFIRNYEDYANVRGNEYNDVIFNSGDHVSINGGEGSDSIESKLGRRATLRGGRGNDTLVGSEKFMDVFQYASGDGKDVITNFESYDILHITDGSSYSTLRSGSDLIVSVGSGSITLKNTRAADIYGGSALKIWRRYIPFDPSDYGYIDEEMIAEYEDQFRSNYADNVWFGVSEELARLCNEGSNVTINAGSGNNRIELDASAANNVIRFGANDGNDTLIGFNADDTIRIAAGSIQSTAVGGNDYVIRVVDENYDGSLTLKDAVGSYNLNVSGARITLNEIETISNSSGNRMLAGTSARECIVNGGANVTLVGSAGDDTFVGSDHAELYRLASNHGNNLITNFGAGDSIRMTAGKTMTFAQSDGDVLVTLKGTNYTGVETLKNISVDKLKKIGNNLLVYQSGETIEGSIFGEVFAFSSADGDNVITNFGFNDTLQMTAGKTMTYSTLGSDVIVTLKGTNYTGTITLQNAAGMSFKKSSNGKYLTVDGVTNKLNRSNQTLVSGSSGRDYIESTGSNVTLEGKGGDDTLVGSNDYGDLFLFSSDAGNDVIANFASNDTIAIVGGRLDARHRDGDDYVVKVKSGAFAGSLTLKDAGNLKFVENGNYLTVEALNYVVNRLDNTTAVGSNDRDFITSSGQNVTIQGNRGNDTLEGSIFGEVFAFSSADGNNVIKNFGANDTLKMIAGTSLDFATVGADVIATLKGKSYTGTVKLLGAAGTALKKNGLTLCADIPTQKINTSDNVIFSGSSGADYMVNGGRNVTIASGGGKDTIEGSSNAELFQFASNQNKNVVRAFGTNDTLQSTAGTISGYSHAGNNTIVTLKGTSYTGYVTLRNTAGYKWIISDDKKFLTVDAVNDISNGDDKKLVSGSTGRDYIVNSGNQVTIQSGGGDDTIEGSAFGEVFAFSSADGNNLITNFGANDTLRMIAGKTMTFETIGADVLVTLKGVNYTGVETLRGAAGLNFQKSGSSLRVTGVNQKLNASNNVKVAGTSGADFIINTGERVTIQANGGADTITGSDVYGELFNFSSADGHNVITNFGTNDSIKMIAGKTISYVADDDDYVITLKGTSYTGTIRLLDAVSSGSLQTSKDGKSVMLLPNASSAELAASVEDYWFDRSDQAVDEIDQILSIENNLIAFEFDPIDRLKPSAIELVHSARSRLDRSKK